jgi:hypothetical protein
MRRAAEAVLFRWERLRAEAASRPQEGDDPARGALVNWRTAALMVAIERLARVTLQRGIWP